MPIFQQMMMGRMPPPLTGTNATASSATAGTAYSNTTTVPGMFTNGSGSRFYSLNTALPAGLSMNGSTGAITGTPTAAGVVYQKLISITCTDTSGSATAFMTISVNGVGNIDALAGAGAMNNSTGWTPYWGTTFNGTMNVDISLGSDGLTMAETTGWDGEPVKAGSKWRITYTVTAYTHGSFRIIIGGAGSSNYRLDPGTYTEDIIAGGAGSYMLFQTGTNGFKGSIDNVTIYPVVP